jgi:hypothetical protein
LGSTATAAERKGGGLHYLLAAAASGLNMSAKFRLATVVVAAAFASAQSVSSADEAPTKLVYRVNHSKYGDIGTYSNTIQKSANEASVRTQGQVTVSILGITAYRQSFDRTERWQGTRLVDFHGITTEDGKRTEVRGTAEGDHFALSTPRGTVAAPGDVKPANPWSEDLLRSENILTPEDGKLERVAVSGGEGVPIMANGQRVQTRHYQIIRSGGAKRYEIWFDEEGVPVRFADISPDETVTFNLSECQGTGNCARYNKEEFARR